MARPVCHLGAPHLCPGGADPRRARARNSRVENVWDYPRPPALVPCERRVRVELGGVTIADSERALRVLETSHPPTIYVPPQDVAAGVLTPVATGPRGASGRAARATSTCAPAAASPRRPPGPTSTPPRVTRRLAQHVSFYPGRVDAAWLDDERVVAQPGDFYGGWITSDVRGPFKGAPGTRHW